MRASTRDGQDALRASAATARALEMVKTLCGRRQHALETVLTFAGVGRNRASARDGQDALCTATRSRRSRCFAGVGRSLETVKTLCGRRQQAHERSRWSRRFAGIDHKRASARDGLDALRASAASARVLETVLTLYGRRPQTRQRSRWSRLCVGSKAHLV
jgi:hypothetical protein